MSSWQLTNLQSSFTARPVHLTAVLSAYQKVQEIQEVQEMYTPITLTHLGHDVLVEFERIKLGFALCLPPRIARKKQEVVVCNPRDLDRGLKTAPKTGWESSLGLKIWVRGHSSANLGNCALKEYIRYIGPETGVRSRHLWGEA